MVLAPGGLRQRRRDRRVADGRQRVPRQLAEHRVLAGRMRQDRLGRRLIAEPAQCTDQRRLVLALRGGQCLGQRGRGGAGLDADQRLRRRLAQVGVAEQSGQVGHGVVLAGQLELADQERLDLPVAGAGDRFADLSDVHLPLGLRAGPGDVHRQPVQREAGLGVVDLAGRLERPADLLDGRRAELDDPLGQYVAVGGVLGGHLGDDVRHTGRRGHRGRGRQQQRRTDRHECHVSSNHGCVPFVLCRYRVQGARIG